MHAGRQPLKEPPAVGNLREIEDLRTGTARRQSETESWGTIRSDIRLTVLIAVMSSNPRLFVIAGPLEGAFFALPTHNVTIGSEESNLIALPEGSAAPHHCELCWEDEGYVLRDRTGRMRTFVNALPVAERRLVHGDEIRVGDSLFLYLSHEGETPWEVRFQGTLERLELESRRLGTEIKLEHGMVGESLPMQSLFQAIAKVAPTDSTVLVRGESGTGKELVAKAIHRNSLRAAAPFVAINCAAIPESLLESELFGHERGAFTGAVAQKRGKIEMASGGTLFLDEVAELAPALQAKLLRVLQEREFERVGGTHPIRVDIRLIAATNRDLRERVLEGQFRADFYYRLNVVNLTVPPLRQRREDIPRLAEHFARKFVDQYGRPIAGISPEAMRLLVQHDWPGNVRELENAIERAVVLGANWRILPEDLPDWIWDPATSGLVRRLPYHQGVDEAKRRMVLEALREAGGNFTAAARALGLHPNNLHRLVRTLNLRDRLDGTACHSRRQNAENGASAAVRSRDTSGNKEPGMAKSSGRPGFYAPS